MHVIVRQNNAAIFPMRHSCLLLACLLLAMALAVSGCAVAPPPGRLLAAAHPDAKPSPLHVADAAAGTLTFRPVGPNAGKGGWGAPEPEALPKTKGAKP